MKNITIELIDGLLLAVNVESASQDRRRVFLEGRQSGKLRLKDGAEYERNERWVSRPNLTLTQCYHVLSGIHRGLTGKKTQKSKNPQPGPG